MTADRLARDLYVVLLSLVAGCSTADTSNEFSIENKSPAYAGLTSSPPRLESNERHLIETIERNWKTLLEQPLDAARTIRRENGQVVVDFVLRADGKVEDLRVTNQTVSAELSELCLQAVRKSEPFRSGPEEFRTEVAGQKREVRITFNYR